MDIIVIAILLIWFAVGARKVRKSILAALVLAVVGYLIPAVVWKAVILPGLMNAFGARLTHSNADTWVLIVVGSTLGVGIICAALVRRAYVGYIFLPPAIGPTADVGKCSRCGVINPPGARICDCGAPLAGS